MNITLYRISKKINSTMLPDINATESITVTGSIKKSTSYNKPSILIDRREIPKMSNIDSYNMLSFNLSKKIYYFVDDINIINNDILELVCTKDVLSTYKSQILSTTQYIARAVDDNKGVVDMLYPVISHESGSSTFGSYYMESGDTSSPTFSGFWTVTMSGAYGEGNRSKIGTDNTYILPDNESAKTFFSNIFSSDFIYGLGVPPEEISESLMKSIYNPFQYIKNVLYFPGIPNPANRYENPQSLMTEMNYGYWLLSSKGIPVLSKGIFVHRNFIQVAIGKHPQTQARGEWINLSPYTTIKLQAGPFGQFVLDNNYFFGKTHIVGLIYIDLSTGDSILRIYGADREYSTNDSFDDLVSKAPALEAHANLAIPVSLSSMRNSILDAGSSAISTSISTWSSFQSGDLIGTGSSIVGGAMDIVKSLTPGLQSKGVTGSLVNAFTPHSFAVNYEFQILAQENPQRFGRPIHKIRQLSELSGYVKCVDSTIEIPANKEDCDKIKMYLDSGVYIE